MTPPRAIDPSKPWMNLTVTLAQAWERDRAAKAKAYRQYMLKAKAETPYEPPLDFSRRTERSPWR